MTLAFPPAEDVRLMEQALRMTQGFAPWSPLAMNRLLASSHLRRHVRGDALMTQADPHVFAVVTGHVVAEYLPASGKRFAVALLGPNLVVGLGYTFKGENEAAYEFFANDDVLAIHMPTLLLMDILEQQPELWKGMARMILRQHREVFDTMAGFVLGAFPVRLATTIERLAELYGSKDHAKGHVHLRLRQEDLAAILHVTRQTVNQELKSWKAAGVVRMERQAVVVVDSEALRRIAQQ
jgi:CRP-like cAMP-binding protein